MVEWDLKVIFCIFTSPKFNLGEAERSTFQVVAKRWKLIFFLLTNLKCNLVEVKKGDVSRSRIALSTYFGPVD